MDLFDLHCDTAYECAAVLGGRPLSEGAGHLSLDRGAYLGQWRQVFAVFMPDEAPDGSPLRGQSAVAHYERVLAWLQRQEREFPDRFVICRDAASLERATEPGVCGAMISVEGGSATAGSLERIRKMYADGVRMMTLTWNAENELGSGVWAEPDNGLSGFGRQAVALMNELGMAVDVSHLSDRGFWQVAELAKAPFAASHSCARSLCGHRRNLTDDMFRAVRDAGGIVGVNFYKSFLRDDENASLDDILRHTEHFLALGGEKTVCMGSDFDGAEMPRGVTGVESMGDIYECFLRANYGESLVRDIFSGNAMRFFKQVIK